MVGSVRTRKAALLHDWRFMTLVFQRTNNIGAGQLKA
jgi:hypothetical protein